MDSEADDIATGDETGDVANEEGGKASGSGTKRRRNKKTRKTMTKASSSPLPSQMDAGIVRGDSQANRWGSLQWKERPCHFTWNVKVEILIDYDKIVRNIDHDLEETPNLLGIEGLLFRAYLEVWDSRQRWDVRKAREFLDKADECIERADKKLQTGYRAVALLNRIWIEYKSHNTQKVTDLLTKLGGLKLEYKDMCVMDAVRATALTRLGPSVMDTALQLYETALHIFPKNPGFLYGAALLSGRKWRYERNISSEYKTLDRVGKTLMDKEKEYFMMMMTLEKDEYQIARSSLGLNLSRRGKKERQKGCRFLTMAYEKAQGVQEVCRNLARYYRGQKQLDDAISILKDGIQRSPNCHENHYQLAKCYISNAKRDSRETASEHTENWNDQALEELDECLRLNQGHTYALTDKCKVLTVLGRIEEAERIYDNRLQQSEHMTKRGKIYMYFNFAEFLDRTPAASRYESRMDLWHKVMDTAGSFEYLNDESGKWQVKKEAKSSKKTAHAKLLEYYEPQNDLNLVLGILHFQNFDFQQAKEVLIRLDPSTDFNIPRYLAHTYLKWGLQQEVQALSQKRKPEEATRHFSEAYKHVLEATKLGLSMTEGRQLLADVALAMAHNQLQVTREVHSQGATADDQGAQQMESTSAIIPQTSPCIQSYREAVRCGSLVASLELLRLIQNDHIQVTPKWQFLQILAEMDVCCSQRGSDYLHKEKNPLSFGKGLSSRGKDDDLSALNSKTIKRDIMAVLRRDNFYRQAWRELFNMEREILNERFRNNDGELELDGREDDSKTNLPEEIVYAAADCCEKLRPLLDRIVDRFGKEEINIEEEKRNQYFPLILDDKNALQIEENIHKILKSNFGIDMGKHYPKLFKKLLQVQPATDSQNEFLKTFCTLVNKVKHSDIELTDILEIVEDPVTLARQCTDKVEEICNYFFVAMEEAKDLRQTVEQLLSDIRAGQHEKADKLLEELSSNQDFVVRMGSTWKLLEMVALILQRRKTSCLREAESKLVDGECALTHELRRRHLQAEVSVLQTNHSSQAVLKNCEDACREAINCLDSLLGTHKKEPRCVRATSSSDSPKPSRRAQQTTDGGPVAFPFHNMHPGDDSLQRNEPGHWKGIVKRELEKDLNKMGIPASANKKLVDIILQAQPCVSEDNYRFLAVQTFLKECDDGGSDDITDTVCIQTANSENQLFQMLDLTRWCTDNAEKIAIEVHALKVPRTYAST